MRGARMPRGVIFSFVAVAGALLWLRLMIYLSDLGDRPRRERFAVFGQEARRAPFVRQHGPLMLRALRKLLRGLARRLGGEYETGPPDHMPRVLFRHNGAEGLLTIVQPGEDSAFQRAVVSFVRAGGFDFRLEARPQTMPPWMVFFRGIQDVRVGDASFDPRYLIQGSEAVRAFFSADVRRAMDRIRALGPDEAFLISVNAQRLRVEKAPPPQTREDFDALIAAARTLHDGAADLSEPARIDVLDAAPSDSIVCQVCGESITSNRVECARCATPHHRECWAFNRKCSTFGCGETKYV